MESSYLLSKIKVVTFFWLGSVNQFSAFFIYSTFNFSEIIMKTVLKLNDVEKLTHQLRRRVPGVVWESVSTAGKFLLERNKRRERKTTRTLRICICHLRNYWLPCPLMTAMETSSVFSVCSISISQHLHHVKVCRNRPRVLALDAP